MCDLCTGAPRPFLACSLACLSEHQRETHGASEPASARAAQYQTRVNGNVAHNREWYAGHRARVTALLRQAARGGALCVLGAGNGSDLDLPALADAYESIHLVDVDGEALERCRAGAPAGVRERLVLHEGVDLSGFIDKLDEWGEIFPVETELGRLALVAIQGILSRLGRRFDVVVSTCALSQLAVPYHRAWVLPAASWAHLHATLTAVHLATIAGATEPGGTGLLVFDVLSSKNAPELRALDEGRADDAAVGAFVARHVTSGAARLEPEPEVLLARLRASGLERLVRSPHLTAPWLWNIGAETQLVFGLVLPRA